MSTGEDPKEEGRWWHFIIFGVLALGGAVYLYIDLTAFEVEGGQRSMPGMMVVVYGILGKWGVVGLVVSAAVFFFFTAVKGLIEQLSGKVAEPATDQRARPEEREEPAWSREGNVTAAPLAGEGRSQGGLLIAQMVHCRKCSQWFTPRGTAIGGRGECPRCGQPIAADNGAPALGKPAVPLMALAGEQSKGFGQLKKVLVVFCGLLSPLFLLVSVALVTGVGAALRPYAGMNAHEMQSRILYGFIGSLAYGLLVAAAVLFGRAAYLTPGRHLRALGATGALLGSVFLVIVFVVLASTIGL